jgi:3-dehydroquinate synthase
MEELKINTGTNISRLLVGESIANLPKYIPAGKKVIVITDCNILKYYGKYLESYDIIEIGLGEQNKNLTTIDFIMGKLVEFEAERSSFIVGVGGGIVSDVAGFAASIYMRGLRFGFVTTTLLSQVDASVGGKNGVNYKGFKNMVGVFNQPEFVICDFEMLKTLNRHDFIGGFAEIIKHGAIKDYSLFEFLENNVDKALNYDAQVLLRLVRDSVDIKAKVVEQDEREQGERRKLNFGHTFGHAIEKLTSINHGQAVAIGMYMAAQASVKKGLLAVSDAERLKTLIEKMQLPTSIDIDKNALFQAMKKDKKREGGSVHLVLLESLGSATVVNILYNELEEIINDLRSIK